VKTLPKKPYCLLSRAGPSVCRVSNAYSHHSCARSASDGDANSRKTKGERERSSGQEYRRMFRSSNERMLAPYIGDQNRKRR
jgi:hypothetical protein